MRQQIMNLVNISDPPCLDLATENPKPAKHNRAFHTKNLNNSHGIPLTPNPTNPSNIRKENSQNRRSGNLIVRDDKRRGSGRHLGWWSARAPGGPASSGSTPPGRRWTPSRPAAGGKLSVAALLFPGGRRTHDWEDWNRMQVCVFSSLFSDRTPLMLDISLRPDTARYTSEVLFWSVGCGSDAPYARCSCARCVSANFFFFL
jgi:hypothetical protein